MECFGRAPAGNPLAACRQPVLLALLADDGLLAYRAFDAGGGRVCLRRQLLAGARPGRGAAAGAAAGGPSARLVRFDGLGEGDGAAYRRGALSCRGRGHSKLWPAPAAQRGPCRLKRARAPRRAAACSCAASSRSGCSRCAARWLRTPWTWTAPCRASRPSTTSTARGSAPASATRSWAHRA